LKWPCSSVPTLHWFFVLFCTISGAGTIKLCPPEIYPHLKRMYQSLLVILLCRRWGSNVRRVPCLNNQIRDVVRELVVSVWAGICFQKIMFLHIDAHVHSTATWYHQFCIKIFRYSFFCQCSLFWNTLYHYLYYKVAHSIVNISGNCIVDTNKILQCT